MKRVTVLVLSLFFVLALVLPAAAAAAFPEVIPLPTAFRPEGIALGPSQTFYAGSLADGTILKGSLRTGESDVLVPGAAGNLAVGMSYDVRSGNLFVAGGTNGVGRVYDGYTGALLAVYPMFSGGAYGDFINDVIVTREAAYFTNSFAPYIYRVPLGPGGQLPDLAAVQMIPLSGAWVQEPGAFVFNANGIEAKQDGQTLIVVNSFAQSIYQVDPATGVATEILVYDASDTTNPVDIPNGDGLVLQGQELYVVQNQLNQIAVIRLSPDLATGVIFEAPITDPMFAIPTTAAASGNALYVVNAKFGSPPATTDYEIIKVPRN